ncbi:MAG: rhomboid family intramembrane serine protease, partial [Lachnospiraceae bacterium]|nr:rhomboid family intramembrane serine protease [Lachnospiraceae bacterium]
AESGFVNVAVICDADEEGSVTDGSELSDILEKINWRFLDARAGDVHILTLVLSADPDRARGAMPSESLCWIVDSSKRCLIVDEDMPEDFYGIRKSLEEYIRLSYQGSRFVEAPLEYEAGGRLCYRHIGQRPVINHALLIMNLFGYVLCILFTQLIYDMGDLRWDRVLAGEWYRIFSHMFIHADPQHLMGNMLLLLLVGDIAERALGHIRYAILYMAGGVSAAVLSMAVSYYKGSMIGSVGASGAVFAVVGAILSILILNHGRLESLTIKKILFLIAYTLYFGFTSTDVDNAAHIGGLAGGFILGGIMYAVISVKRKRRMQ